MFYGLLLDWIWGYMCLFLISVCWLLFWFIVCFRFVLVGDIVCLVSVVLNYGYYLGWCLRRYAADLCFGFMSLISWLIWGGYLLVILFAYWLFSFILVWLFVLLFNSMIEFCCLVGLSVAVSLTLTGVCFGVFCRLLLAVCFVLLLCMGMLD